MFSTVVGEDILRTGSRRVLGVSSPNGFADRQGKSLEAESFPLPSVQDPAEFCRSNFACGYGTDHAQDIKFAKGTTTLAFKVR